MSEKAAGTLPSRIWVWMSVLTKHQSTPREEKVSAADKASLSTRSSHPDQTRRTSTMLDLAELLLREPPLPLPTALLFHHRLVLFLPSVPLHCWLHRRAALVLTLIPIHLGVSVGIQVDSQRLLLWDVFHAHHRIL